MNGIHDMGGMHGFGPVDIEQHEPFHDDWEKSMHAIRTILGVEGVFNVDELRAACERLDPVDYLSVGYYGIRVLAIENLLIDRGILHPSDLEEKRDTSIQNVDPDLRSRVQKYLQSNHSFEIDVNREPKFEPGDTVVVKNVHPRGHTRSPHYIRGARGSVLLYHGIQRFPDESATGNPEVAAPLYSVEFTAEELWGVGEHPNDTIILQLWEPYIKPTPTS